MKKLMLIFLFVWICKICNTVDEVTITLNELPMESSKTAKIIINQTPPFYIFYEYFPLLNNNKIHFMGINE